MSFSTVASPYSAFVRSGKRHPPLKHLVSVCQKPNTQTYRSEQRSRAVQCTACARVRGLVSFQAFSLKLECPLCIGSTRESVHLSLAGGPGKGSVFPFHPCYHIWLLAKARTWRDTLTKQGVGEQRGSFSLLIKKKVIIFYTNNLKINQ